MSESSYDVGTIVDPDTTGTVMDPDVVVTDAAIIEPTDQGPVINEASLITYPSENL